jgi:hypothetical protein
MPVADGFLKPVDTHGAVSNKHLSLFDSNKGWLPHVNFFCPEDGCTGFLQNFGACLPTYISSYTRSL